MKSAKIFIGVLFLSSLLVPAQKVHADISPPPAPQLGGLEPFQYQNTSVQMAYERVEMDVQPILQPDGDYYSDSSRVQVTAYFTMHNGGTAKESMQVIFPLESFSNCRMGYGGGNSYTNYFVTEDSFRVEVEGTAVPLQKVVTDHPDKSIQNIGQDCGKMSWVGFDVTFPAGEDVVIKVEYRMETMGGADLMQNIEYILETGAGWAGPIQRGYVIVKFPYVATPENVLTESTPGYQFLYNEVFWSFDNLEPTRENNIQVSIVSPATWQRILSLRRDLKENPKQADKWLELAQIYDGIGTWHNDNVRSEVYRQKVGPTYEQGIAQNPDSPSLPANYAQRIFYDCCLFGSEQMDAARRDQIVGLINKALALDPKDPVALDLVESLNRQDTSFSFTPPATIPPTATSLFTETSSPTATVTLTPFQQSEQPQEPIVVTVVRIQVVTRAPTRTARPQPSATPSPTDVIPQEEKPEKSSASPMIFGALIIFAAGIGLGMVGSKRWRK